MFERVNVKEITPRVYLLDESGESTGYLVVGSDKAALIDTMNGGEDLKALAASITDLPVMVINTHGHCDHIAGNIYFEEAWIHPADLELAKQHMSFDGFVQFFEEKGLSMPPFKFLEDGQVIDLGDLTLQVIWMPGHTQGSILLLLKEERILRLMN
jgi:glyoxylase-like metal-dependent hydrolase (beta-lactamase superfamily II)